ncbi:sensor histidine kinase [Spongiimicrobium sp. 3-5]|uniref:sensor histidine kinase n=1 Tax=Spongiimicrobium sp. 3-5 TaxID=3332596 RepID=UPI003980CBBE
MASRNFYIQLIFRVILITLTSLGVAYALFWERYFLMSFLAFILVLQAYLLITYINSTNLKIAYFFNAIRNEDFTLRFPEKVSIKSFKELNHSLNRVNGLIQEVHLKLQTREQYYQEILKQANIGILTYNEKGHILYANPTVEKLLNHKPLNHIKQLGQVDEKLYSLFAQLRPFDNKLFQLTNEREKTQLALKATALKLDGEPLLLVVVQDIHKELEEKETDSWVRLIRVLTHEIMNTIAPITSISESILKYFKKGEGLVAKKDLAETDITSTTKGLQVIREQGGNLMSFVQSYRSFLSIPAPDKELVSAFKLLEKVKVFLTQDGLSETVSFDVEVAPKELELYVDEKQLMQVLINLSKNALQSLSNTADARIKVLASRDNHGKSFIAISDNGPGIPPELIDEIFVPFFTTKNSGTGIGLSLSRQIIRLHGGNLKVRSLPNKETTFTMVFD